MEGMILFHYITVLSITKCNDIKCKLCMHMYIYILYTYVIRAIWWCFYNLIMNCIDELMNKYQHNYVKRKAEK